MGHSYSSNEVNLKKKNLFDKISTYKFHRGLLKNANVRKRNLNSNYCTIILKTISYFCLHSITTPAPDVSICYNFTNAVNVNLC